MTEATCTTCGHGTANADGTCGPCRAVLGREPSYPGQTCEQHLHFLALMDCPGCAAYERRVREAMRSQAESPPARGTALDTLQ